MSRRSGAWQPTTIKRFVQAFPTSACTVLVETDVGQGYLKALGNGEGPHILASELVATELARWFGLPTFDFSTIEVSAIDELPFHNGNSALPGPAFITRAESGDTWSGDPRQLEKLANPHDISRLVVFDTWMLNCDRYLPEAGGVGKPRVNRNNVFLSEEAPSGQLMLKAMDHTHCFTCGRELTRTLRNLDKIRDPRTFGLFPEFRRYLDRTQVQLAAKDLRRLTRTEVVRITQGIPREWDVQREAVDALTDLVVGRAAFVADQIETRLWPQGEFDFGEEATEYPS